MSSTGGQVNFPVASNEAEHVVSSPPTNSTASVLPPHPSGSKLRSSVWNHFTQEIGSVKKVNCNYCGTLIKYEGGTGSMHLRRCIERPENLGNKRKKSTSSSHATTEGRSPSYVRFDQEACRKELVKMFVECEVPFRFVEHDSFRRYSNVLQPKFVVPSRGTLAFDILKLWDSERTRLKKFLHQHYQRACLTTDTWTSCQTMTNMCLTLHFIDSNWKLHKKILAFRHIKSHTGEVRDKNVETILKEWGLTRVLSLIVDNASSNDAGIRLLKKRLKSWGGLIMNGDHVHMRCCAHILNLIVKDGLKEIDDSIKRLRGAVKHVRLSSKRFLKFKGFVAQKDNEYKCYDNMDCESRWNSTYLLLEAVLKHQTVFQELEFQDEKYADEFKKSSGLPLPEDWEYARTILSFLNIFYQATFRISSTSYVTSGMYMLEVVGVCRGICHMLHTSDVSSSTYKMAEMMMQKYNKYWGYPDQINMILLIAVARS